MASRDDETILHLAVTVPAIRMVYVVAWPKGHFDDMDDMPEIVIFPVMSLVTVVRAEYPAYMSQIPTFVDNEDGAMRDAETYHLNSGGEGMLVVCPWPSWQDEAAITPIAERFHAEVSARAERWAAEKAAEKGQPS
jgi:hypothetical protein